ncbi:hypothetical protein [Helcococcus kunzii]|uniref:hypothetical protein n=1 Tax=Helcococcus kunzii TaxID=40091 RepID=UPI0038AF762D
MKKSIVEEYIGKKVVVKIDNDEYLGILQKGTGYERGYYHCNPEANHKENHFFRSSHILGIKEVGE